MAEMHESPAAADPLIGFKLHLSALRGGGLAFEAAPDAPPAVLAAARPSGDRIGEVTGILRQTPTGRATLAAIQRNRVALLQDDAALDALAPPGVNLMAAYDPGRKAILLRGSGDAEAAATLLVHEGRHALQDASGSLGFQKDSWRMGPSAYMDAVRAVEADATALQTQFAAERRQAGQGQAWEFMRRTRPAEAAAFDRAMAAHPGDWPGARAAVFDAFVADPRQTAVYVRFNLPQWTASLQQAGRPDQVGRQDFALDSLRPTTRAADGNYLDRVRPPAGWRTFDAEADRSLTTAARQLVTMMQRPPADRAPLLDTPEGQQALQMFRLRREDVAKAPRWTPAADGGRPAERQSEVPGVDATRRERLLDRGH